MSNTQTGTGRPLVDANDLGLLCVVVIWGLNLAVVKFALGEMLPLAFNAARFGLATIMLLALLRRQGESLKMSRRDLILLIVAGFLGHTAYQLFFIEGIARTTASHAALIFGISPVVVALLSMAVGHERIRASGWIGAALALAGVYVIMAGKAPSGGTPPSLTGDLFVLVAAISWCAYTVMARPLLARHSPLKVTTVSMSWGVLLMLPLCAPQVIRQPWGDLSPGIWLAMGYSCVFALVVAYILWYRSVKQVGNMKTAIYSNLVPVTGTLAGWLFLGERLYPALGLGAAAIFGGIALTKMNTAADAPVADRSAPDEIVGDLGEEF